MSFWIALERLKRMLRKVQHENQRIESVSRFFCESAKLLGLLVDLIGIEPMTSSMPWKRAPSCATGPLFEDFIILAGAQPQVKRPFDCPPKKCEHTAHGAALQ